MRRLRGSLPAPVGFVPTMGALHAGHESLVARAQRECATVVVSIFVNPLQFAPHEDFDRYPRTPDTDVPLLQAAGVDILFMPSREAMYPDGASVRITLGAIARHLEGERRPGFLSGVATVVLKLFNVIAPDVAYFGQKDAQQLAVVARMVEDLNMPQKIVECPTVREPDGLALSSRNAYLDESERRAAPHLFRALRRIAQSLEAGERAIAAAVAQAEAELPPLKLDYLAVVEPRAFEPLANAPPRARLLALGAAYDGATRLIDNVEVNTP